MKQIGFISLSVFTLVALGCERIPIDIGDELIPGKHGGTDTGASSGGTPSTSSFKCNDGTLISELQVCNQKPDCPDGSDEANCTPSQVKCNDGSIVAGKLCDGVKDCKDSSDEVNCTPSTFKCNDGIIVQGTACDGIAQCKDGSDESNCFKCNDGSVIPASLACNQKPDCADGSDETNCPDPCVQAHSHYDQMRTLMLDKYGSVGCNNSTDCVLVLEDNACAYTCNVALPSQTSNSFVTNIQMTAPECTNCPAPIRSTCDSQVAACVNGQCMAVSGS